MVQTRNQKYGNDEEFKVDPAAPKRPIPAYFRFKFDFMSENKDHNQKDVKTAWEALTDKKKKPYVDAFEKLMK